MSDVVTPDTRSRMMSNIRSKDTRPERVVRSGLFCAGFRFRLHRRDLPGRPDIVLARWRAAIFINGCFWHAHPGCRYFRLPKSRSTFWAAKLESNRARDAIAVAALVEQGWRVITVWECAIRANSADTLTYLQSAIEADPTTAKWEIRESQGELKSVELLPN